MTENVFTDQQAEFSHFLGELDEFLASQSPTTADIVIMGDFNLPHGDWSGGKSAQGATGDEGDMVRALNELTSSHFLVQQVECPTHKDGGTLDLVITNNGDLIYNFNVLPSPKSDHFLIEVSAVYKEPSGFRGGTFIYDRCGRWGETLTLVD